MSIIGSNILAGASGQAGAPPAGGYQVERSLRFNSSDSAYLSRTPGTAGNRRTWTWAGWVKRSAFGAINNVFNTGAGVSLPVDGFTFHANNTLKYRSYNGSSEVINLVTTQVFRDLSAWFHLVFAIDTTQSTSTNRVKIYVNGAQITAFSTATYGSQNYDTGVNATMEHRLGDYAGSNQLNGYLADIHFIDGQALTPSSFTEVSATTGQLVPIEYTGTYGTNGFWLSFSDNSAATAATLGADTSGNGNNWTPNNLSVTAGAGNDSLVDTPTSYGTDTGVGGEVRGNYATLNPLDNGGLTLSNGNLQFDRATASWISGRATIGISSGKWYWEVVQTTGTSMMVGISQGDASQSSYVGAVATGWAYNSGDGNKYNSGSNSAYGNTYTTNDVIGVAFDADSGDLKFYKNGAVQNSGTAAYTGLTIGPYFPAVSLYGTAAASVNFGQRAFAYTAPSGFKALCDTNLPAPLVALPSTVMDVKLWTGNGAARSISGLAFSPDFAWIKGRSGATNHALYDAVRGVQLDLVSNSTAAETTQAQGLTAFNSDGFSLGTLAKVNTSSATYVAWTWDAGANSSKTYTVTVASAGGANRYFIDGVQQATINLEEGSTYIFDQSAASNSNHPLRFSTTSNGTHGGGTEYTTGVTTVGTPGNAGAYTQIAVASGAPALYYYCTNHSQMGGAINTNTTAGASNFVGSISSQVRANASAGFSVVTYTGTGANATVGHGLGVAAGLVIVKRRDTTANWQVRHTSIAAASSIQLNLTNAAASATTVWNSTAPSSTVFSVGTDATVNASGATYVAYCFAPVDGYSSFGSYTGNGSANGPFVYLGFRPAMVMVKMSSSTGNWTILDDKREGYNVDNDPLFPNLANAEGTTDLIDITSNGFKVRTADASFNTNAGTYIYAAWASSPFQSSRAR